MTVHDTPLEQSDSKTILSACDKKSYNNVDYINHPIIQRFGSPNRDLYIDDHNVNVEYLKYEKPLVLPLYNAELELIQCAVLELDKPISIVADGIAKGFAYFGEMQKDKPVILTYSLEAFFKIAQTDYSVVLIILPQMCNQLTRKLKESDFKKIHFVVKQLEKAGFRHLYMPIRHDYIKEKDFTDLTVDTGLHLLSLYLEVESSNFLFELSRDEDPCEISAFIEEAIVQVLKKPILPHGHLAKSFVLESGENLYILEEGLVLIQNKQSGEGVIKPERMFISPPIVILGEARSLGNINWKRVIQFSDKDGKQHIVLIPYESFMGEAQDALKVIANNGLMPPRQSLKKNVFIQYIQNYPINKRFRCVDRVGWHGECYVTPNQTYGKNSTEELLFSCEGINPYTTKGTFEGWKELSHLIELHNLAVLTFSCAFSGQLVELLGVESGGFHIYGSSTDGKSTITKAACSIWGVPKEISKSWRTTDNALENEAELRNDNFLNLDELRQAAPKSVSDIVYMLTGGQGKARSTKVGKNRDSKHFNLMYTSTGEVTLEEHLRRGGIELDAGLLLRFAHLPSDAGKGYGVFDEINYGSSIQEVANQINFLASQHYGHAGIKWLEYLTQNKPQILKKAQSLFDEFIAKYKNIKNGQIQRVLRRFALVAVAGELATQANITGWRQGRAFEAVEHCFKMWSNSLNTLGSFEERKVLEHVKAFFESHGSSRFEDIAVLRHSSDENLRQRVSNRVGYYDAENKMYLISPTMFKKEICIGMNEAYTKKVLMQKGWLKTFKEGNRNLSSKKMSSTLPDGTRPRMMYFSIEAINADDEF